MNTKKPIPLPSPTEIRQRLEKRIAEAKLPSDLDRFTWAELEASGMFARYTKQKGWDDKTFLLFVLMAEQSKALRKERDNLKHQVELSEDYHSPLRVAAYVEPCPIKKAQLHNKAAAEEQRVNEQRRRERDPVARMLERSKSISARKWEFRDEAHPFFSTFTPARWHEPMTLMDYHEATGLSRRTVKNILDRAGARPLEGRKRPNEPARYGQDSNAVVLQAWLIQHVKNLDARRALLAQTLAQCKHDMPEHFGRMVEAIIPVVQSLGITTEEQVKEFKAYLAECEQIMFPPLPPSPPSLFGGLAEFYSAPAIKSEPTE